MEKKVTNFFAHISKPNILQTIRKQVEENTQEVERKYRGVNNQTTRRGNSQLVLDGIHDILGNDHKECRNSEATCLNVLVREYMDETNGLAIIKALELLLPNLYFKLSVLAKHFSTLSKTIQTKFPNSNLEEEAKKRLHLSREGAILRRKNYQAKVYQANAKQRQLSDSEVLATINKLAFEKDWPSLTVCVGLAVGSRLVEILKESQYERADHSAHYIRVVGVVKDRGAGERKIVKPIVGGLLSDDIKGMVDEIRVQVSEAYDVDLGTGTGDRKVTKQELTNLTDKKVNDKIREVFGPTYVFHDTRAIYAELAFLQFAPDGMSKTAFFATVLGHKEESLTTALSYQKFAIKRKLPEVSADILSRMTTLEAEINEVKKRTKRQENKEEEDPFADEFAPSRVRLWTRDGEAKTYAKQPRIRDGDEAARMRRLEAMVAQLDADNVKTTHANLRRLGFGGAVITKWSKGET